MADRRSQYVDRATREGISRNHPTDKRSLRLGRLTKAVETEEFKRFLEYIPIAIVVSKFIRGDERICYANRAFETLTGRANKDCAGRDWSLLAAFKDESDSQVTLELESFDSAVQAKRNLLAATEKVAASSATRRPSAANAMCIRKF
jgi:PAS domain-containing protein